MSSQGSLFGMATAQSAPPPLKRPTARDHLAFRRLSAPSGATLFAHMIEIGVLWNRLTVTDQMDYEDAIRLRG